MTPRSGLKVALIGLAITGLCGLGMAALALLANLNPDVGEGWMGLATMVIIIVLVLAGTVGHIVMVVGLVMAAVRALGKQAGKPY
jgi:hypothetical protein